MGEQSPARTRLLRCASLLPALLLLSAGVIVFAAFHIQPSDSRCDRHTYPWSPALDIVKYHWETFKNHQFSISTPYFGFVPTDEIEDAWHALLSQHPIAIPSSRLEELGRPDSAEDPGWVHDPENHDAILALPEYAVQLGCLNFLRQVGYRKDRDFTYLDSFMGGEVMVWERAYQCLERLRHAIMCHCSYYNGDTTIENGVEYRDVSFDFGTLHYCRNFETINDWTKENGLESVTMDNLWW